VSTTATTAVYFDLDGTLLRYERAFGDLVREVLPAGAPAAAVETYTDRVLTALSEQRDTPYELAFRAACEAHDVDADPDALAADYRDREVTATHVPDAARELLETVANRHPTGVLTNGEGRMQRRKLVAHDLDSLVDAVLVSNVEGVRKPDPAIFERARERLPADTHVYVGDTYEEDVAPARAAGFETVYVGDERAAPFAAVGIEALAAVLVPLLSA